MHVYKADTGATYHILANNLGEAMAILWEQLGQEGTHEEIEEYGEISVERLKKDKWPAEYNNEGEPGHSFAKLVADTTEPGVLVCSEW